MSICLHLGEMRSSVVALRATRLCRQTLVRFLNVQSKILHLSGWFSSSESTLFMTILSNINYCCSLMRTTTPATLTSERAKLSILGSRAGRPTLPTIALTGMWKRAKGRLHASCGRAMNPRTADPWLIKRSLMKSAESWVFVFLITKPKICYKTVKDFAYGRIDWHVNRMLVSSLNIHASACV